MNQQMSKDGFIQITLTAYNAVNFNANNKKDIFKIIYEWKC